MTGYSAQRVTGGSLAQCVRRAELSLNPGANCSRGIDFPSLGELPPPGAGFAELLGYDLDRGEVTTDQKVRLTPHWQAINEEPLTASYTVFTYLLSQDRRLIGQHDGIPAGGERPTTSWVLGEVIADMHEMEFSDLGYRGRALIEVGLYESFTIERVPTEKGSDHLILPSEVVVEGER